MGDLIDSESPSQGQDQSELNPAWISRIVGSSLSILGEVDDERVDLDFKPDTANSLASLSSFSVVVTSNTGWVVIGGRWKPGKRLSIGQISFYIKLNGLSRFGIGSLRVDDNFWSERADDCGIDNGVLTGDWTVYGEDAGDSQETGDGVWTLHLGPIEECHW